MLRPMVLDTLAFAAAADGGAGMATGMRFLWRYGLMGYDSA